MKIPCKVNGISMKIQRKLMESLWKFTGNSLEYLCKVRWKKELNFLRKLMKSPCKFNGISMEIPRKFMESPWTFDSISLEKQWKAHRNLIEFRGKWRKIYGNSMKIW